MEYQVEKANKGREKREGGPENVKGEVLGTSVSSLTTFRCLDSWSSAERSV